MRLIIFILIVTLAPSCRDNRYAVSKVLNGNSIELANGFVVVLDGVKNDPGNIRILERYIKDEIDLFDADHGEVTRLSGDTTPAIAYNSYGDCLNEILKSVEKEAKDTIPAPGIASVMPVTIVPYIEEGGVMRIQARINTIPMEFIFDTGASLISISKKEANNLRRLGKLGDSDRVGKGLFSDANGDITEGMIINLESVQIGNRTLDNVQACVIEGQHAALLMGRSALKRFGKVSFNNNNEIILE